MKPHLCCLFAKMITQGSAKKEATVAKFKRQELVAHKKTRKIHKSIVLNQ
tara:strand:- start:327 stop:476 length:150 start_codon:yes stop_codon:yes gene_type:complete